MSVSVARSNTKSGWNPGLRTIRAFLNRNLGRVPSLIIISMPCSWGKNMKPSYSWMSGKPSHSYVISPVSEYPVSMELV